MSTFNDPVLSGQFLKSRGWPLYTGSTAPPPLHFYCFHSTIATTYLLFSLHRHHHHHIILFSLHHNPRYRHISIVFTSSPPLPLPTPPHFYCFLSTIATTYLLFSLHRHHHHHIILFSLHHNPRYRHISIVFTSSPPLPLPTPPHFYCFLSTTTTTTFLLFSLHHHRHHISIDSLETKVNRDETSLSNKVVKNRKVRGELKNWMTIR